MELYPVQYSPWSFLLSPAYYSIPENYVRWAETPESHLFSADLPGLRKEEIRVEVEDSRYLIIRTELDEGGGGGAAATGEPRRKKFMRKFRLPERVDMEGISAGYEDGVLTVTVPRLVVRGPPRLQPADMPRAGHDTVARAA